MHEHVSFHPMQMYDLLVLWVARLVVPTPEQQYPTAWTRLVVHLEYPAFGFLDVAPIAGSDESPCPKSHPPTEGLVPRLEHPIHSWDRARQLNHEVVVQPEETGGDRQVFQWKIRTIVLPR